MNLTDEKSTVAACPGESLEGCPGWRRQGEQQGRIFALCATYPSLLRYGKARCLYLVCSRSWWESSLFGGGLVLLARVVRPWRGGDQVLLVFLAVVVSVLGLAIGWLGITLGNESTETAAPQPTVTQPTAAPPLPTSTAPPATARPTVLPPQVTPIPTIVVTAPRPTTPPPAAQAPSATAGPVESLVNKARELEEQAVAATNPADKLRHLRSAEVIARSLLASDPCEYSLQELFIRICRKLSLLDPAAAACANAPACSSG